MTLICGIKCTEFVICSIWSPADPARYFNFVKRTFHAVQNKITALNHFYINLLDNALEFNRVVTYRNESSETIVGTNLGSPFLFVYPATTELSCKTCNARDLP